MKKKIIISILILIIIVIIIGVIIIKKQNNNTNGENIVIKMNEVTRSVFYAPQYVAITMVILKIMELILN